MGLIRGRYLDASPIIDWDHPKVLAKARELARGLEGDVEIARRCYEFVRDDIHHSGDHRLGPVTLRASDVLEHRTGFCYAKAHLLAALLRANGISAGLSYQRLRNGEGFCLHGLNSIFLKEHGWYRVDARGNSDVVHAEFDPPREVLAFTVEREGEEDMPEILSDPFPSVVKALSNNHSYLEVLDNLPDVEWYRSR